MPVPKRGGIRTDVLGEYLFVVDMEEGGMNIQGLPICLLKDEEHKIVVN